jgi:hypothetical protein
MAPTTSHDELVSVFLPAASWLSVSRSGVQPVREHE